MKNFDYTIKDELGIHVRPAGQLAQLAKTFNSTVTLSIDGKDADVTKLFAVMGLAVKSGNTVTITVEGDDEDKAAEAVENFFKENL